MRVNRKDNGTQELQTADFTHLYRQQMSYSDCLEDKSEDYENCSVLYCASWLYQIIRTLTSSS